MLPPRQIVSACPQLRFHPESSNSGVVLVEIIPADTMGHLRSSSPGHPGEEPGSIGGRVWVGPRPFRFATLRERGAHGSEAEYAGMPAEAGIPKPPTTPNRKQLPTTRFAQSHSHPFASTSILTANSYWAKLSLVNSLGHTIALPTPTPPGPHQNHTPTDVVRPVVSAIGLILTIYPPILRYMGIIYRSRIRAKTIWQKLPEA